VRSAPLREPGGIAGLIAEAARRWPGRRALVAADAAHRGGLAWDEVAGRCEEIAGGLAHAGLTTGRRAALRCAARPEALCFAVAALEVGLTLSEPGDADVVLVDTAADLRGLGPDVSGIVLRGTVPDPHASLEVLSARGIASRATRPGELAAARAGAGPVPPALLALDHVRGPVAVVAPVSDAVTIAALPLAALTGAAVCLAPDVVRAIDAFAPHALATTAAGADELAAYLDRRPRRPWRRTRLRAVLVDGDVREGLRNALTRHGIVLEGAIPWSKRGTVAPP
jgi:hypothetical protein